MSDTTQIRVKFLERNRKKGFSIHKVFQPIVDAMGGDAGMEESPCWTASPKAVFRNLRWAWSKRGEAPIFHVTGDMHYLLIALIGYRTVLTVHDLVALTIPGNILKRKFLRWIWCSIPFRMAGRITCISEKTKQEMMREFRLPSERITVIHNPVDPIFRPSEKVFCHDCPQILHVGTGWNKNVIRVAEALEGIPCNVVFVGKLDHEQKGALKQHNINYIEKYDLTDEELAEEYRNCDIVSFPSIFEGFGMPIIEGQMVGRCVLTSRLEPMTEVAGQGAVLVNPESTDSIREGFQRIITDAEVRERLLEEGRKNVQRFCIERIVAEYEKIYKSLQ